MRVHERLYIEDEAPLLGTTYHTLSIPVSIGQQSLSDAEQLFLDDV